MISMILLIIICVGAFAVLLWMLRRDRMSFGLPVAYLYLLLLVHVPGAFAHIVGSDFLVHSDLTEMACVSPLLVRCVL